MLLSQIPTDFLNIIHIHTSVHSLLVVKTKPLTSFIHLFTYLDTLYKVIAVTSTSIRPNTNLFGSKIYYLKKSSGKQKNINNLFEAQANQMCVQYCMQVA